MPFRYILTLIFLLVPFLVASAQDTVSLDAELDRSSYMWQDLNFRWVQVSDISCRGLAAEAGVVLSFNDLVFSAGLSSVSFRTLDFTFGVGISF